VEVLGDDSSTRHLPVLTYSLGNFYCGQRFPHTRTGVVVSVRLAKDESGTRIDDAGFTPIYIYESARLRGRYRILAVKEALAGFTSGADSILTASDTAGLRRELDEVTARVTNPSIPFHSR
jgi:poly-gamma-glutamate capsule biosynthesis protein CapA/YwtB (metallophosphatase superfamily)